MPYHWGDPGWVQTFGRIADAIVAELAPKTVLDAGCGIGFLVDALRKRGVDAYGLDISEYAISQVPEELRAYCSVRSITEELERDYDLIVCIEVLEHLPPDLGERAIANLAGHTDQILFSSSPDDFKEPTHLNVQPPEYWIGLFARHGFFRNVDLETAFVAPHAVHLVRSDKTPAAVARDYERWHWRHRAELQQLRDAVGEATAARDAARASAKTASAELARVREQLDGADVPDDANAELAQWYELRDRSGYRIFLRLAAIRARIAPPGSVRDRAIRRLLRVVADAVDDAHSPGPEVEPRAAVRALLFVSGCPGDAKRYRCEHQAAQLRLGGATVDVVEGPSVAESLSELGRSVERCAGFVLHRMPWSREVELFVERARDRGLPVVFDIDDLVFEPEASRYVAAVFEMDDAERSRYLDGLRLYQRTLRECNGVLASTEPLREAASRYNPRVEIAYNAASDEMVGLSDAALEDARAGGERRHEATVTVAYFSGTPTHDRDFLEAADAVLWALEAYDEVRFLAVGHLTLDARFEAHANRTERLPLQAWERLPELLARTDVNLAPLEPDNPFTDAKSCLKYVEAGLVATPTIASPRPDFVRAIEHGRNGLLADSPDAWKEAMKALVESPELRRAVGQAAFEDVRRNHTVRARSHHLLGATGRLMGTRHDAPLTINWMLKAPIAKRGGGYRTIFRLASHLGAKGHLVRVYVDPIMHLEGLTDEEIVRFVEEHFGPLHVDVHVGEADIAPADATLATNWPTAPVVATHELSLFKLYFIQDFEPHFFAPEDPQALAAEQTYALPLGHICYGRQLARTITAHTGKHCDAVDFALEPAFHVTTPPDARPEPLKVLFFARPDQRRRGYDLGVRALEIVHREEPDVELVFFGATDRELGTVPFPVRNLGVVDEEALAAALNDAHIFLGLSFTNISHAPFEAMACGSAVVELDLPGVTAMVDPDENCLVAEPQPEALADAILRLVRDRELRLRLATRGAADMRDATWERTGGQFEQLLRERCFVRLPAAAP